VFKLDAPWDAGHEFGARSGRGGFAGRAAAERVRGRPVHLPPLQDVPGVEVRVEIAGVPEDAMLTAGRIQPSGVWALDRDELSGLRLLPVGLSGARCALAPVSLQVTYIATNLATGQSGAMVTDVFVAGTDGQQASVESRVRTGAVLGTVAVPFEADESEVVRFRLVDDAGGRFAIDTWAGTVTVADGALFAGDAGSRHVITVEVASVDGWMTTQQFAVTGDRNGAFTVTAVAEEDPADAAAPWAPATLYLPRRAA
jgi:hypothetical protein